MTVEKAPIIAIERHRIATDGVGVTTLVGFWGCPLRCKHCINPHSFFEKTKPLHLTPEELYQRTLLDQIYFLASGGGVTFGGGEPLLYPQFLQQFRALCGTSWHLTAETSLAVPWESVEIAASCIDEFWIDCKDTNDAIYTRYTGKSNALMLQNLARLVQTVSPERIVVRLPLIPDYNTEDDVQKSQEKLSALGITRFDRFTYRVENRI